MESRALRPIASCTPSMWQCSPIVIAGSSSEKKRRNVRSPSTRELAPTRTLAGRGTLGELSLGSVMTGSHGQTFAQLAVERHALQVLFVRAEADHAAAIQHQDLVGVPYRRQPVRDHERGAALHQRLERLEDVRLGARIERRRGL